MALLDDSGLKYFWGLLKDKFAPKSHTHTKSQITDFPKSMPANGGNSTTVNGHSVNSDVPAGAKFTDTTYSVATASSNGLMTAADKAKLNGIASNANNYSHPTSSGNKHIPAGGSAGQILRWSADGTATWGADNNTTYSIFKGASSSAAGGSGLVPPPAAGSQSTKYLRADGTWTEPPNTTYANATKDTAGLMTAADKTKLDGIATGANKTVVDNALSQVSANPVANSAITKRLQYLYSFKISRDKWNESSDKSNWNVIVPWSDSSGTALTGSTAGTPNLTTGMSLGPAMMERTSSLSDNIILSGELSMINQGQIYVCDTNKLSFTVKRRPVCDLMLYFYARQWTT